MLFLALLLHTTYVFFVTIIVKLPKDQPSGRTRSAYIIPDRRRLHSNELRHLYSLVEERLWSNKHVKLKLYRLVTKCIYMIGDGLSKRKGITNN